MTARSAGAGREGRRSIENTGRIPAMLGGVELDRGASLRDQVYKLVRKAIVTGRLPPGAAIDEAEIATALGISRTPVREAVKKASDEGLIDVRAQSGTFVTEISRKQVSEAYVIRIALELESVRHAAARVTDTDVHHLSDLVDAHEGAIRRARFDEAIFRDDAFHHAIAEVSDFSMLWRLIEMSKAQMDRCRMLALPTTGAGETTILQHRSIVDALAARDALAAGQAIKAHLEQSFTNTLAVLDRLTVRANNPAGERSEPVQRKVGRETKRRLQSAAHKSQEGTT